MSSEPLFTGFRVMNEDVQWCIKLINYKIFKKIRGKISIFSQNVYIPVYKTYTIIENDRSAKFKRPDILNPI